MSYDYTSMRLLSYALVASSAALLMVGCGAEESDYGFEMEVTFYCRYMVGTEKQWTLRHFELVTEDTLIQRLSRSSRKLL